MERIINVDMEINTKNINTALNRFFKKYSSLIYWKETFEYMYENATLYLKRKYDRMKYICNN